MKVLGASTSIDRAALLHARTRRRRHALRGRRCRPVAHPRQEHVGASVEIWRRDCERPALEGLRSSDVALTHPSVQDAELLTATVCDVFCSPIGTAM